MIYHVLPEAEVFSEQLGGATSRWAANVLRNDANAIVVCAKTDLTWQFNINQVIVLGGFSVYRQIIKFGRGRIPWKLRRILLAWAFSRLVNRLVDGDVIYVHNRPEYVSVLHGLFSRKHIRIVLHLHNSHLVTYAREMVTPELADLTVFCSRFLEAEARGTFPSLTPTTVLSNGADSTLFSPRETLDDSIGVVPVILFVGRLVPEKGAHIFVEALRLLQERGISARGVIVGSSEFGKNASTPYIQSLHKSAPTNVAFLPYMSGRPLAQIFRKSTVFCCPSVWNEAFGMVNVEAMASRLPVVAANVGGIADIFTTGGAILVPPNSGVALADALSQLVADPALRDHLAAEGYSAFLRRFDWRIVREDYRRIIDSLPLDSPAVKMQRR